MQLVKSDHTLNNQIEPNSNLPNKTDKNDEIKRFTDARYISASEACWRIFSFKTNSQYPNTTKLVVHLENQQNVIFDKSTEIKLVIEKNEKTQLTEFFHLNATDLFANSLLYYEIPKYYTWDNKNKKWNKRKKNKYISKYYFFLNKNSIIK